MAWEKSPLEIRTVPSTSLWRGRVIRRARIAAPAMPEEEPAGADEQEDLLDLAQLGVHGLEGHADHDRAPFVLALFGVAATSTSRIQTRPSGAGRLFFGERSRPRPRPREGSSPRTSPCARMACSPPPARPAIVETM